MTKLNLKMGKILITIGAIVLIIGLILQFTDFNLNWFGNLPGDVKIKNEGFSIYFPWVSMLVLSIVFSLLLWIFKKLGF